MKAIAYTRVSTEEQVREGVSLAAQEERLRAYCIMAGLDLVGVVREEGVSGSKVLSTRPGGKDLLARVQAEGIQHIVALKLDRLFRDAADALNQTKAWDKAGVSLHLVDMGGQTLNTGSAMGRMFLTMTAAFAELERNLISERTKFALAHLKANGVVLGAPSLHQAHTIARIQELRVAGKTLREIALILESEGHQTLKGGKWAPGTILKVLRREKQAA